MQLYITLQRTSNLLAFLTTKLEVLNKLNNKISSYEPLPATFML